MINCDTVIKDYYVRYSTFAMYPNAMEIIIILLIYPIRSYKIVTADALVPFRASSPAVKMLSRHEVLSVWEDELTTNNKTED